MGIYFHRLATGTAIFVACLAITLAWISQSRYQAQKKKVDDQGRVLDAVVGALDSQGRVNQAFLKALKSIAKGQTIANSDRTLASTRP